MGPPLSPRETRRSGRRSLPSASASTSKSPDCDAPPKQKDSSHRPPLTSNNSGSGRQKRLKKEDPEDPVDDRKTSSDPSTSTTTSGNLPTSGRAKRKQKDKEKHLPIEIVPASDAPLDSAEDLKADVHEEEEEQGITRCVCGSTGGHCQPYYDSPYLTDSAKETTTQMPANSWCNARLVKSGSTGSAWDLNLRINLNTKTITTANNVNQNNTPT